VLQLALIRILETYFRNPILYLIPAISLTIFGLIATAVSSTKDQYVTGMTIHIRPNELIQKISISTDRSQSEFVTSSQLMASEMWGLLDTKPFMDELIERAEFDKPEHWTPYDNNESIGDSILNGFQTIVLTDNQIVLIMTYENYDLTAVLLAEIFDMYLDHKINIALEDTANANRTLVALVDNYEEQRNLIEAELRAYIETHPAPEDISLVRRDIEIHQIERLETALYRADESYADAKNRSDATSLATTTIESSVVQSYIIIDSPIDPVPITGTVDRLRGAILLSGAGIGLSIVLLILVSFLNQRIMVPLDAANTTNLPILIMVAYDSSQEEQNLLQRLLPVFAKRKRIRSRQSILK